MMDKLILTIYRLSQASSDGEADREECRNEAGIDRDTYVQLLERLDRLGYLASRDVSIGSVKLSLLGVLAAKHLLQRA